MRFQPLSQPYRFALALAVALLALPGDGCARRATLSLQDNELLREIGDAWPEVCRHENVRIFSLRQPVDLSYETRGVALIQKQSGDLTFLSMPDCTGQDLSISKNASTVLVSGGALLKDVNNTIASDTPSPLSNQKYRYYLYLPEEDPVELIPPRDFWAESNYPVISAAGDAVIWLVHQGEGKSGIEMTGLDGKPLREIHIPDLQYPEIVAFDRATDSMIVTSMHPDTLSVRSLRDGKVLWGPVTFEGPLYSTGNYRLFRQFPGSWVRWENTDTNGPEKSHVDWHTPSGKGTFSLPSGYHIQTVAVDPKGRYAGVVSGGMYHENGGVQIVYMLNLRNGHLLFSKKFTHYQDPDAAFLGDYFAYSFVRREAEPTPDNVGTYYLSVSKVPDPMR